MKVAVLVLLLTLASGTRGARAPAQETTESQVKAAFLYNFVKFVDWPSEAFSDSGAPIIVGVVGEDSTTSAIDHTISGKIANGRRLLIKRFSNFRAITRCHVLFISSSQRDNLPQILAAAGSAVLTVGETERFAQMGGIINFTIIDNKLRFEINQAAAERAGLRISAKLLSLARVIRN
ncbi:MAG: YfiR family protein [Acidobacteriota bacterium]